jgi:hypothetical protein
MRAPSKKKAGMLAGFFASSGLSNPIMPGWHDGIP